MQRRVSILVLVDGFATKGEDEGESRAKKTVSILVLVDGFATPAKFSSFSLFRYALRTI